MCIFEKGAIVAVNLSFLHSAPSYNAMILLLEVFYMAAQECQTMLQKGLPL